MPLLDFEKTKKVLKDYNIEIIETKIAENEKEGLKKARSFGYPVVLKVFSPDVLHRTEKGLVLKDIRNDEDFEKSFSKISKLRGVKEKILVQKQVEGIEVAVGFKRSKTFGPVIMFGLGGIFIEVLKDISFDFPPLGRKEARGMMRRIKGFKILEGYRGKEKINFKKMEEVLIGLSELALENPQIKEADLNPVFCWENKVEAVDFKLIL